MPDSDEILTIKDVADYLKVNERAIYKLAQDGLIPTVKIANQWRFRKSMIDAWLDLRMSSYNNSSARKIDLQSISKTDLLAISDILKPYAIDPDLKSDNKEAILKELVDLLAKTYTVRDRSRFLNAIISREKLCSTAIIENAAIPHPRYNGSYFVQQPALVLGRSRKGIDFNSIDGKPTHLFFLLCAPTDNIHLMIMAKLSRLLNDETTRQLLLKAESPQKIIEIIQNKEKLAKH